MPQASSRSPQAIFGLDAAPPIVLPALVERRLAATTRLAGALNLTAGDRERLIAAVRTGTHPPAVAASLLGLAADPAIAAAVADLTGVTLAPDSDEAIDPPPGLNARYLAENYALALSDTPQALTIGLVDPSAPDLMQGIEFAAGKPVAFTTIPFSRWRATHNRALTAGSGAGSAEASLGDDAERLKDFARDAPVVRYLDGILEHAVLERASDLHFEQKIDRCVVRMRIDGALRDLESLAPVFGAGVIARAKVLADLDVAAVRSPQDGRATLSVRGRPVDLRVSTTPTVSGESAVVRILSRQGVDFTLDSLGFDPTMVERLEVQLRRPYGLILVTGPTGGGKTTTLYAALRKLATRDRKVLTVEDPIEYIFDGINQTQVNEAAGVSFASALRAFLRHDPDVILVGEIRNSETARLAVQAALTGHLVLATLHTNDAASAPARLADLGVERYLLAGVLIGVCAQRLAPRLCAACAQERAIEPEEAELFEAHGFARAELRLREGLGCAACAGTGRKGRLPLGEVFTVDETVERLISTGAPTADIRAHLAGSSAFRSLTTDALAHAARGDVAVADVFRAVGL